MKWKCENCEHEIEEETIEKAIEETEHNPEIQSMEDVGGVLYPCPNCDKLTNYTREGEETFYKDTSESKDSSNTQARSKMLQAARN